MGNDAKALIAESYGTSAAAVARFADRLVYDRLAGVLADRLLGHPGPYLDVAAGTGALTRKLGADAVACDLVAAQLSHNAAQRKVQADAEALPFGAAIFGVAASAFGINHFPAPAVAVGEMARVARVVGLLTWRRPEPLFMPK